MPAKNVGVLSVRVLEGNVCGTYGYVSFDGPVSIEDGLKKTNGLLHRGPENMGFYSDNRVFLGHTRLSFLDLRDIANQPFKNSDCCLVYNGEVYKYLQLKEEYFGERSFLTGSDTEVLFELM